MARKFLTIVFLFNILNLSISAQSLYSSLNPDNVVPSQIIATIDSLEITAEEFFYSYEFGPSFTKRKANSKQLHLDFMINEKLLALKGINSEVSGRDEANSMYCDITSDIATEELYKDSILSKVEISDYEIEQMANEKKTEIEISWIFAAEKKEILKYYDLISNGISFDSLFKAQINDSVFADQRSLKTSLYNFRKKNPILASICDTLLVGQITKPINVNNEWYIAKKNNFIRSVISTESEWNKLRKESSIALTKMKMDSLSDLYVHKLMKKNDPVIKRNGFNIARSFIAKYRLDEEKNNEWELDQKLELALNNLGLTKDSKHEKIKLVELLGDQIYLNDFIQWFRNRNLYIKLNKSSLREFSRSLENLVWLMIRDRLLIEVARTNNYYKNSWVKTQAKWWKEKIEYSTYKNELVNFIKLMNEERNTGKDDPEIQLREKIFQEITKLKNKYEIKIDYETLNNINVSTENDKNAINFYAAKNRGLIPRPPYPTIDNDWANWL